MKAGQHCRLVKLEQSNPGVLALGTWSRGLLMEDIVIGSPIRMIRYARAARDDDGYVGSPSSAPEVRRSGIFTSSMVIEIGLIKKGYPTLVKTLNSTWEVTLLGELDEEAKRFLQEEAVYVPAKEQLSESDDLGVDKVGQD